MVVIFWCPLPQEGLFHMKLKKKIPLSLYSEYYKCCSILFLVSFPDCLWSQYYHVHHTHLCHE